MTIDAPVRPEATRDASTTPAFSFVIPAYNEADDIIAALEAVGAQSLRPHEIIVVDDGSTDGTPARLREWDARRQLKLIEHGRNRGAAAARNTAIRAATGDVLVFLDADNMPPPDFLERLAAAYQRGADFVSVESRVANQRSVVGRFQQAHHEVCYGPGARDRVGYTQAFSCRTQAAREAGFPDALPGFGGEDVEFFRRLLEKGYTPGADFSIEVLNQVPDTLPAFWRQYRARGRAVPYIERRLRRWPLSVVIARRALAAVKTVALGLAVAPALYGAAARARRSPRGWRDLPAFWLLLQLHVLAHRAGEWETVARMVRTREAGA
ncbi:MAG TPA: glycosyltransferase family A protein [Candidatus Tectomicrobia bacterium]|nr:glycosyltransferase family A protein [Candidatus Tectomicrobia bacterium]